MKALLIGTALAIALVGNAFAQEAPKVEKKSIPVAECGQMWKAHKASATYVDPGKGKRSEAWNTYRREHCSKDRKEG